MSAQWVMLGVQAAVLLVAATGVVFGVRSSVKVLSVKVDGLCRDIKRHTAKIDEQSGKVNDHAIRIAILESIGCQNCPHRAKRLAGEDKRGN